MLPSIELQQDEDELLKSTAKWIKVQCFPESVFLAFLTQ